MAKGKFSNPIDRARKISQTHKLRKDIEVGSYFKCLICNKDFWRKPCAIKKGDNKFCSRTCYFKWQKGRERSLIFKMKCGIAHKGNKNWNWKGGITPEIHKIRNSEQYRIWREEVFKRDDWTCQDCKKRSRTNNYVYIQAHHIKPFSIFPELRFEIDNGVTLCKKCHDKKPKGKEILCLK